MATSRKQSRRCAADRVRRGVIFAVLLGVVSSGVCRAQVGSESIPSPVYLASFGSFYEGEYKDALQNFRSEARSGIRNPQSRWIDSICYDTMTGECYYHMGQLGQALEQYTSALKLYLAFSDWMLRVQYPPAIQPAGLGARVAVPWGQSQRNARLGRFPDSYLMSQGRLTNSNDLSRPGTHVIQNPVLFSVNAAEIVRATTLAIRRRREILGPLCKYDPITKQVVAALSRRPGPPNHWSSAWIDVQLGVAQSAAGNAALAAAALDRAVVAGGEFDHPLTGVALFELGRLALEAGDLRSAARMFEETTYAATNFGDAGLLEEAFRFGQVTHLIANSKGVYPPLVAASNWARTKREYRQLYASLQVLLAENLTVQGQARPAAAALAEARAVMLRTDLPASDLGARLSHAAALASYQGGNVPAGDQALAAALTFQRTGSLWMFHIGLVSRLHAEQNDEVNFSDRIRLSLFETVLRDPNAADWSTSPLECLSVLTLPHPAAYEQWFEAAYKREKAIDLPAEIADRARRHRFFSQLPTGGRLLSLRWVLEAPQDNLPQPAVLQRQDLLARYPRYAELSRKAADLRGKLLQQPIAPEAVDARSELGKRLAELADLARQQEIVLHEMAVRREPCEMVFPPPRKLKDVQQMLPRGHVLLTYFATSSTTKNLYAFMIARDKYASWRVGASAAANVQRTLSGMLRELGNYDQNHVLSMADLSQGAWKKSAAKMGDLLFDKTKVDLSDSFQELVVVPDGILWYLPFEVLPVGKQPDVRPLAAKVRVRYAPTMGLAVSPPRSPKEPARVAVAVGKLYPQDKEDVARGALQELAKAVPDVVALPATPPAASSVYRAIFGGLIVLDDVEPADGGVYDWSPAQIDRGKPGSTLGAWLTLPWGSPDLIVLPGFHTAAENGLAKKNVGGGNEIFLSVCAMLSTGTRTVLISRWRTGGQTSFDLVREFTRELGQLLPADAWQRSIQLAMESPLDPQQEPRLKRPAAGEAAPKAEHPFFWSGYMLVDSGSGTQLPTVPAAPPAPPIAGADKAKPAPGAKPPAGGR